MATSATSLRPTPIPEETLRSMDTLGFKWLTLKKKVLSGLDDRIFKDTRRSTECEYQSRVQHIKDTVLTSIDQNLNALYTEFKSKVDRNVTKDTLFNYKFSNLFFRCHRLDGQFQRRFHVPLFPESNVKNYFLNHFENSKRSLGSPETIDRMTDWIERVTNNTTLWTELQHYEADYHHALLGNMFYKGYRIV